MLRVADDRRLLFEVKASNSKTRRQAELESGKGVRFDSIYSLMEDLNADD